jgi:predicted MFS family arabinose efflux permease
MTRSVTTTAPLLRNREFRRLWAATTTSQVGSAVTLVVMPLIAVVSLKSPPSQLGLLYAAGVLPMLLVRLPAASWADTMRWGTPVLILTDLGRAAVLGTVPVLWWIDRLTFGSLLAVVVVSATLTGVQASFYSPLLLGVVPREQLPDANGKLLATRSVVDVSGPGLAGLVVSVVAAPVALVVDAASFLASAGILRTLRRPADDSAQMGPGPARAERAPTSTALRRLAGSLLRQREIVAMVVVTGAGAAVAALQVLFMVEYLSIAPALVGPILGLGAVGGVAGGLLLTRLTRTLGPHRVVQLSVALVVWSFAPLPFCGPGLAGIVASVNYEFAGSAGGTLLVGTVMSAVQAASKPGEIARTIALAMMSLQVAGMTGAVAGGVLAEAVGVRAVIAGAVVAVLPVLWYVRTRGRARSLS